MTDIIITDDLIKVYRLPVKLTNGNEYAFGAGVPITFTNVDCFNAFKGMTRADIECAVRKKSYFKAGGKFLVLSDNFTFALDATTGSTKR